MTKITSPETGLEIAVIGMSGKFPGANNLEVFWNNLKNGVETISRFTPEELRECGVSDEELNNPNYVRAFGILTDKGNFDSAFFGYSPKEAETMDPMARLFHECAWEALEDAGYDPIEYNGAIGLYAGASTGFDWQVLKIIGRMNLPGGDSTMHMTENSLLLSTRISHKLNLMGPSITMFTACSTALVAIHMACRSLLTGECQIALAGAGSVNAAKKTGYMYQEGMILSPDGHCRSFDACAGGTLYGDGVGVVVLKRLKHALVEADNILGIIKASAVNNDGTTKASFTAPGKKRITDVMRTTLKLARLTPETVHFIEAHGTATAMGDTIEMEALKAAFATDKKGFCGLGSIKSNFGHLDVAAGIASFIKVVLSLKHRLIPPSLHFEIPNPAIDFIDSPFFVNAALSALEWDGPFRAGVCSFGIGGTNAFMIVESVEPRVAVRQIEQARPQLLLLSARTDSALERMTANLALYLKENPHLDLADVAYTLQVGRRAFSRRRILVCSTTAEAAAVLSAMEDSRVFSAIVTGKEKTEDQWRSVENTGLPATATELTEIGSAWLKGASINWQELYDRYPTPEQKPRRISLPFYPFERQYYWIETPSQMNPVASDGSFLQQAKELSDWFYIPSWERAELFLHSTIFPVQGTLASNSAKNESSWLLFIDEQNLGENLREHLVQNCQDVVIVRAGVNVSFTRIQDCEFMIDPAVDIQYDTLFAALKHAGKMPGRIIHLWNVQPSVTVENLPFSDSQIKQTLDRGFYSLLNMAKAIGTHGLAQELQLLVVTSPMEEVSGDEPFLSPLHAPLLGVIDVLPLEYPYITCCCVDILPPPARGSREALYIRYVLAEMAAGFPDRLVAYRGGFRWTRIYKPLHLDPPLLPWLKHRGVYLITGGLGGIGLTLAQYLSQKISPRLILVGRSAATSRQNFCEILEQMEKNGAQILIVAADVSDEEKMRHIILQGELDFGPIDGIFHTAGVADYAGVIEKRTRPQSHDVLAAKIYGTMVLERIFKDRPVQPRFLVLFSSLGNILYGDRAGQVGYNAANHFLDAFSGYCISKRLEQEPGANMGMHTLAINWPPWLATGMARNILSGKGNSGISAPDAIEVLARILGTSFPRVVVCAGDLVGQIKKVNCPAPEVVTVPEKHGVYPRPPLSTLYEAPRDNIQMALATVWQKFFGICAIGIFDDFFELGGDSLKAITVITDIQRGLDVRVPITQLFRTPTIAGLADYIKDIQNEYLNDQAEQIKNVYADIQPVEEREYYPLSSVQKRIYILHQMAPGGTGYNTPLVLELSGVLDKELLVHAFRCLMARHESLRTSFELIGGEPVQRIHPDPTLRVDYIDLHATDNTELLAREEQLIAEFIRPFDLAHPTLLRVGLIRETPEKHVLMIDMHHIITDGSSIGILIREFILFYTGQTPPPLRIQYKDYSQWQNSTMQREAMKKQEVYWLAQFADEIPVLNLPTDFIRPPVQSFTGNTIIFEIGSQETTALKQIAQQENSTLFMILFSLYNILLAKMCNQEDIVVGTPLAGRTHADLQQVIGMLVNTLALRNYPASQHTFIEFLKQVQTNTLAAFDNQDYLFEDLVEQVTLKMGRDASRNPIFDTMFNLLNFGSQYEVDVNIQVPGLSLASRVHDRGVAVFDLIFQGSESPEGVVFTVEYCTHLFKPQTIWRFIGYFKKIVSTILAKPAERIAAIEMISAEEKAQLLFQFNNTTVEYPCEKAIHQLFEEQTECKPDHIAIIGETAGTPCQLTYAELNKKSNRLAYWLQEQGALPGTIVALIVNRSIEMVYGILGILKAGAAYLPIAPDYPRERIDYMLKDSGASIVLTEQFIQSATPVIPEIPVTHITPINLAYVIYTSGSTGKPKGVLISHKAVVNRLYFIKNKYQLDTDDVVLQKAPYTFDVSVCELFRWILPGAKLCLLPIGGENDPELILETIVKYNVTSIDFVPSAFSVFLEWMTMAPKTVASIRDKWCRMRWIFIGAEVVRPELVAAFNKTVASQHNVQLINTYGPTEATVDVTYFNCSDSEPLGLIPIGKPMANVRIFILDSPGHLQAIGVPGELCIAGECLAAGYLNNPELTAAAFISMSTSASVSQRIYKTGDLARWLADGNIEFLGRIDTQVKIRGFRVELGEIEIKIAQYPGIKEAVVLVREEVIGEKYLCAYFVVERDLSIPKLRQYLSTRLPEYMLPTYFVPLEKIPLTQHGKINRKAFPLPELKSGENYIAPRNETERKLVELWSEVLNIERNVLGIDSNFFHFGGHSLKATILVALIHKEFDVRVPLAEVFRTPTIRELAQYIRATNKEFHVSIQPAEEKEYYMVSSAQKRLFFLHQLTPRSLGYNMPEIFLIPHDLDLERLAQTFAKLIERHESLRTSFYTIDELPVQVIHRSVAFSIAYAKNIGEDFVKPFDLEQAPLFRVVLQQRESGYFFLVDMHHIISDGLSHQILWRDFMALYQDQQLPPLRIQYKDFAEWQNQAKESPVLKQQQDYWLKEFAREIPLLNLPIDYTRPIIQLFDGSSIYFAISAQETNALNEMAEQENVTLFMVILAIFNILLFKLSNQEDIIIGTPIAGRRHVDLEKLIGMFVNTLALRNFPVGEMSFREFLLQVKARAVDAFENQEYQFEDLVEKINVIRDAGRNPFFDVMLTWQNRDLQTEEERVGDSEDPIQWDNKYQNQTSKFDLTLNVTECEAHLDFSFEYCTKLFKRDTLERFAIYFKEILTSLMRNPRQKLLEIQFLPAAEKKQMLFQFNQTQVDYPTGGTIHQLFAEQVKRTPDHIAILGATLCLSNLASIQLSYAELNEKSNCLAARLIETGILPETIVGLMVERSVEMIIGILGILKSGAAYLPIDPDYPQERIDFILKDSQALVVLTRHELSSLISAPPVTRTWPHLVAENSNLAYVIYTSGSTGKPKAVLVEHRGILNTISFRRREYNFSCADRVLQLFSFAFDGFLTSFFTPVVCGASVVQVSDNQTKDIIRIKELILGMGITHFICVPTLYRSLLELATVKEFYYLKVITLAGEQVSSDLVEKSKQFNRGLELVNEYGPTENSVLTTIYRNLQPQSLISIGKPIANTQIYILDQYQQLTPVGVPGQLIISGHGLARGYLNNPQLTADKFFSLAQSSVLSTLSTKFYKTGDLARWLSDGNIEFLGRIDHQVKIRGYRIELDEIKNQLLTHPDVKEVLLVTNESSPGDKYLCAYLVLKGEATTPFDAMAYRTYLAQHLPDYMIPSYFIKLAQIPLIPSGKVNRNVLPRPGFDTQSAHYVQPRNTIEIKLVGIWSELLGVDKEQIGIQNNFFELGGHSLKASAMVSCIHKELNVKVELAEIFKTPTIEDIAHIIQGLKKEVFKAVEPVEEKEYYPLSSAQKRLYFLQQLDLHSVGYNIPMVTPLGLAIEKDKLEYTLKQLIARHESLRTSFERVHEEVVQMIHKAEDIVFAVDYYEVEETALGDIIKGCIRPFELSRAPLIRSGLIKLPQGNLIWIVDIHHIVSDGTSHTILMEDFMHLFVERLPLPPLPLQYKDFAQWQNQLFASSAIKVQRDYWLNLYTGEIPRIHFPADYKRPDVFTFAGSMCAFSLDTETAAKFKVLGASYGGTLFMNMMAVLNTLLYKYTGQTDIIIGCGVAGRQHADLQGIVGMFVNLLAMRNYPHGEKSYQNFLHEVTTNCVNGFENQDVQFEELVDKLDLERDPSRNPLFDISMVVQNFRQVTGTEQQQPVPSTENSQDRLYMSNISKFDMTFFVTESQDALFIDIEYYSAIFKKETITRFISHFKNVIQAIIANPAVLLKDISILSQKERAQLLFQFNDTSVEFPQHKTIHHLFLEQVARTPDLVALVAKEHIITFKELNEQATRLARYLYEQKGVRGGEPVGVWMSQSLYRQVALLGVLKAGGAFVPMDSAIPAERIKYIINDARIGTVLSQKSHLRDLNRLLWECHYFHSYFCFDSDNILAEEEQERNQLMESELWQHVGENATDEITGGGWRSSYTGLPLSKEEMDEYGDNILKKLQPLLHPQMKVLEIGCASGISMYRIAPKVGLYYGTDLSAVIIEKNKKQVLENGYQNITLACLPAHDMHQIPEKDFHLVIFNSVIQCFHGHHYLHKVLAKAIDLVGDSGYLFIGDVMDQEKKATLVREMTDFRETHRHMGYTTKTDFSAELFISRGYWQDLHAQNHQIESVVCSDKLFSIENELSKFRYDVLIKINKLRKTAPGQNHHQYPHKIKFQEDMRAVFTRDCSWTAPAVLANQPAYIIYTSGSTGQPKGVMVEHRSLVNLCGWHNRTYSITSLDRATKYAGFSFDASVWEIFPYLVSGASLYLVPEEIMLDMDVLNRYYETNRITISFLPTQVCEQFMASAHSLKNSSLRVLLTGGDKLKKYIKRNYHLYNNYGPTENTVVTTSYCVTHGSDNIPIGKPIFNNQIYIIDHYFHLLPIGLAGELCIAGASLARGYLNSPELTHEKFISSSFMAIPAPVSPKVYKTGDLARWLSDGCIEFLGRIDLQVKIRGFRIELGEIETCLLKHYSVSQAVVVDRNDNDETYLCAYIVSHPDESLDIAELNSYLSRYLPVYMIPGHFIKLAHIPLKVSGKVDRKALPAPRVSGSHAYIAPADEGEDNLALIWSEVLNVDRNKISMDANFFQLGGHSLKATILVSRIHRQLGIKVPLAEIFKTPTIRHLAQYIKGKTGALHVPIEPAEEKEYYPLAPAQKRLYVLQQLVADNTSYNMPQTIPIPAGIGKEKLDFVFKTLIARHDSLRTSFETVKEEPVQRIHREVNFAIHEVFSSEADIQFTVEQFTASFDLSHAPLLRVGLLTVDTGTHPQFLLLDMHHIITDGTSQGILEKEFTALCFGAELPVLPLQYKDYSQWYHSIPQQEAVKQQKNHWLKEFAAELPVLQLPTDFPRPIQQSIEGNTVAFRLNAVETAFLKAVAKENGATMYMTLLALFSILLAKLSGQEDIIIGTPIAARRHADLLSIIGMFVNTLAMRNYPSGDKSVNDYLKEVKQRTLEAFENQEFPFEELVNHISLERDTSRNPVFDVMFNLLNQTAYSSGSQGDYALEKDSDTYEHRKRTSKFDINLTAIEMEDHMLMDIEYCTKLFKPTSIERFIRYFKNLISLLSRNTALTIAHLELMTEAEKAEVLRLSCGVQSSLERVETIHQLFVKQAQRTPDHIAITGATLCGYPPATPLQMSYEKLNQESDRLAAWLRTKGVGTDTVVALLVERSIEMIIAILGIMKAGGAYLPIDPEYPQDRIDFMLQDSQAVLVLTGNELATVVPHANPAPVATYGNLVYIIYTSGSTGKPKGVMLEHRNLVNLFQFQFQYTPIDCSRILQFTTISFDVSFQEIFSALLSGGQLFLIHKQTRTDIPELFKLIDRNIINTLFLPISFLKVIFQDGEYLQHVPSCIRHIVVAGEQVVIGENFRTYLRERQVFLHNHYGPSETHVVTTLTIDPNGVIPQLPAIGKPILNTAIYILDKHNHLLPIGAVGELCIAGSNLGRGYLNNPQLTADKFISLTITPTSIAKIYKTGDLARWLPEGNIEFLGRIDHQIKIRGFRVELGEIESRLSSFPGITQCVVVAGAKKSGEKYLCAYFSAAETLVIPAIRDYLARQLPDYMIPAYFMPVDNIPVTANGKIDKKRLPVPEATFARSFVPPTNDLEKIIVDIWKEILEIDHIGIDDNFFELGGHSLKATVLISKIHKVCHVRVPLVEIFKTPRIRDLAHYIMGKNKEFHIAIQPIEEKEYYMLSSAQKRLYFLQQLAPDSTSYNMPEIIPIAQNLEIEKLEKTFALLIDRHESLRTSYFTVADLPVQKIHLHVPFKVEFKMDMAESFIRPFDLTQAPLLRVVCFKREHNHFLLIDMHHIITDGLSHKILQQDFIALYQDQVLLPLRIQYKDFAEWQNQAKELPSSRLQQDYWVKELAGEIPVLNLPIDFIRPVMQVFDGDTIHFEISSAETIALHEMARHNNATLFIVLLACFNVLLAKLSGQEDIIVGTPIAGRRHADLEKIIGMFVNTLVLRNYPAGELGFREFLGGVKERALGAFENQEFPFEDVVENCNVNRDAGRNPLFDVMFSLQNMAEPQEMGSARLGVEEDQQQWESDYENKISKFDLTLIATEYQERLGFIFEYCTKLFTRESITRFVIYFKQILSSVIRNPGQKLRDIEFISAAEKEQLLVEFNATHVIYPGDKTIHRLFAEQVERTPDHMAIIEATSRGGQVSYAELNKKSNCLAFLLHQEGVCPSTIVGILAERSLEMIVAILAVWKAGCAYTPLNPSAPVLRSLYQLQECGVELLLITPRLAETNETARAWTGKTMVIENLVNNGDFLPDINAAHYAYVIFTSGSTGNPKGVPITHANLCPLFHWGYTYLGIGPKDSVLQNLAYSFDWSVFEIFLTLTSGAVLYLVADEVLLNPALCVPFMKENGISMLHITPTQFQHLIGAGHKFETLKYLILGAEKLTVAVLKRTLASVGEDCRVFNMYGPTETTIIATSLEITRGDKNDFEALASVPIGRAVANGILLVLDTYLNLCPVNITGQLYIGGDSLAAGYLNNPELTAAKFLSLSTSSMSSTKSILSTRSTTLYKTGDLTRWLADGNLEFLGRIDQQVKIRGFRIELGEIENQLLRHTDIKEAVVLAKADEGGDHYLCAYIGSARELGSSELREYLAKHLPDYMMPAYFVSLEKIPLTPNGKIDRKALPEPRLIGGESIVTPQNELETKLLEIWSAVLHLDKHSISTHANFFNVGGHSLKATILISTIHKQMKVKIPLAEIFKNPTIKRLAEYINHAVRISYISIPAVEKKEYYILSSLQKRLYILQHMNPDSTAYNMPQIIPLGPGVDPDQLTRTFMLLIQRHESLRTSFQTVADHPVQKVHEPDDVAFKLENYQGSSFSQIMNCFIRPFDLSRPPLLRAGLVKLFQADVLFWVLVVDIHHSISDGVSHNVLARDFRILQNDTLPPLRLQYKDFAEWQNSPAQTQNIKQQEAYWLREFEGEIPVLHLPLDFPRPELQHVDGADVGFSMAKQSLSALQALAAEEGVTMYMMFLALFNILLAKLCGQEDIVIGTASAGRRHADLEQIIGMFVNTLVLRNYPVSHKTFSEFLKEIKQRTLAAFENQDYPFEDLVDNVVPSRNMNRNPLFDVMFNFMELEEAPEDETENQTQTKLAYEANPSKFDMTLTITKSGRDDFHFNIKYSTLLFKEKTIQDIILSFKDVVSRVVDNPTGTISQINIASPLEIADAWEDSLADLENE